MFARIHDRTGHRYGVAVPANSSHGAAIAGEAIGNGGIQFLNSLSGENRPAPCIEERIVLHDPNDRLHGLNAVPTLLKHLFSRGERGRQGSGIRRLLLRRQVFFSKVARPAVNRDGPIAPYLHLLLRPRRPAADGSSDEHRSPCCSVFLCHGFA